MPLRSLNVISLLLPVLLAPASLWADTTSFFQPDYESSREQFLVKTAALQKTTTSEPTLSSVQQLQFKGPFDDHLITDVTWIKAHRPNQNLIVMVSGIHGIEGFTGSAIQSYKLDQLKKPKNGPDYLFIHALNPYGFKNFRRVDKENVDLNRNFSIDPKEFKKFSQNYYDINSFLNPDQELKLSVFSRFGFLVSSANLILKYSLEPLRQAILLGQHQAPKGLYFGGADYQYQKKVIDQLTEKVFADYKKIFVIDLHTGYGERSKLHILVNSHQQKSAPELIKIFSEKRIDFGDQKKFYKVSGDLISYLESKSTKDHIILGAVFEFGTLNSQTTMGSIESLRRMVLENQKFHFGAADKAKSEVDELFKEMFYPSDLYWRESVLEKAEQEFSKIENYL